MPSVLLRAVGPPPKHQDNIMEPTNPDPHTWAVFTYGSRIRYHRPLDHLPVFLGLDHQKRPRVAPSDQTLHPHSQGRTLGPAVDRPDAPR